MSIIWVAVLFALGIALIVKGGDLFVDASSSIAEHTGIPKMVVGATIVSFATTMPEFLVSLFATLKGQMDMAVGNAVGSVTANIGLILGISLLVLPGVMPRKEIAGKGLLMVSAAVALWLLSWDQAITLFDAVPLLALMLYFVWLNYRSASGDALSRTRVPRTRRKMKRGEAFGLMLRFLLGAAGIVVGAQLLVKNGTQLAVWMGAPESVIALTFVAIGTSLPELVTTLTAIKKGESALSVGNILGANIMDLTLILAACAFAGQHGGLYIAKETILFHLPVCILLMLVAVVPAAIKGRFFRWQGLLLLALYAGYVGILFLG